MISYWRLEFAEFSQRRGQDKKRLVSMIHKHINEKKRRVKFAESVRSEDK